MAISSSKNPLAPQEMKRFTPNGDHFRDIIYFNVETSSSPEAFTSHREDMSGDDDLDDELGLDPQISQKPNGLFKATKYSKKELCRFL